MESVLPEGVWVDDSEEDDPVLRQADGRVVDTRREDDPYAERLDRDSYEHDKQLLQVELLKLQYWVKEFADGGQFGVTDADRRPRVLQCGQRCWPVA